MEMNAPRSDLWAYVLDAALSASKPAPWAARAKLKELVSVDVAVLSEDSKASPCRLTASARAAKVLVETYPERSTGWPNAVVVASWSHAVIQEPPKQSVSVAVVEAF